MSTILDVITLTPEHPEYGAFMAILNSEPLRTQWWNDAESGVEPGISYSMVLVDDQPAAWAGWYISLSGPRLLRCCNNYVRRDYRNRQPELYELAYRHRHQHVVLRFGLPAITYLFPEPIPLHLADGWEYGTGRNAFGTSSPYTGGPVHHWRRLVWTPTA